MEGFDVDLSQTPPREWLPENVRMRELNIFDEIPDDLVNKFDVVSIRLFYFVVKDGDPSAVIQQARRMLSMSYGPLSRYVPC